MTKKLLRHIAYMCLFMMLGTINWVVAPMTSKLWILIFDEVAAAICFVMAYITYRQARKIAEVIDAPKILTLTIIHHGEESESKGQEQGEAEDSGETETDRQDESEDYCAHPI